MVVRLLASPWMRAQKPKSAARRIETKVSSAFDRKRRVTARRLTKLDVSLQTKKDVVRFDVAMDDSLLMEVLESLECLPRHSSNLSLAHDVARDDVGERSTLHVLHHNPKVALEQERVDIVDNIAMPRLLHDEDLVDDEILLGLLLKVHLLDGDREVGADLVGRVDSSRSSARVQSASAAVHASAEARRQKLTLDRS
jgi:hypothetical protein